VHHTVLEPLHSPGDELFQWPRAREIEGGELCAQPRAVDGRHHRARENALAGIGERAAQQVLHAQTLGARRKQRHGWRRQLLGAAARSAHRGRVAAASA